ncbi:ATP-grasp domain-containing protein [Phytohabitans kaempferiae]|uniref:RimK family alpha-L-glutamate ligase n=1 Tax=Phytohabitans kaempferiae TaxID=1620943 RepID=A0ABV6LUP2_9ACTN
MLLLESGELGTSANFQEQMRRLGKRVAFRSIEDITVRLRNGTVRMTEAVGGRDLSGFASVQMLSHPRGAAALLNAVADYLHVQGVHAVNVCGLDAPTKLYKYVRMANRGVPVPATVYLPQDHLMAAFPELCELFDLPFVLKSVSGGKGRSRTVIGDRSTFNDAVRKAADKRVRLLAQELVPAGEQRRLLVFGDQVGAAQELAEVDPSDLLGRPRWDRSRPLHVGQVPEPLVDIAVAAAKAMNYGLASVHLMKNWTTSRWQVIDISATPLAGIGASSEGIDRAYAAFLSGTAQVDTHCLGKSRNRPIPRHPASVADADQDDLNR